MRVKLRNRIGQRFGRLSIVRVVKDGAYALVKARCDCGRTKDFFFLNVQSGKTKSCGCLSRESAAERNTTHGRCRTVEYDTWARMISRCENEKMADFERYGGRGITICAGWIISFQSFFNDLGVRPSSDYSIERIDNGKGYWCGHCAECRALYRKANCKWATATEQARNRRPRISSPPRNIISGRFYKAP